MTDPTQGHSPLPWRVRECPGRGFDEITSADGMRCAFSPGGSELGKVTAYANAALIVREVNEAPKLREEVERLRALVREAARLIGKPPADALTQHALADAWYVKEMCPRLVQMFRARAGRDAHLTAYDAYLEEQENSDD